MLAGNSFSVVFMEKKLLLFPVLLVFGAVLLFGCVLPWDGGEPTPTPVPTAADTPTPVETETPFVMEPTPTRTPVPTSTPIVCPVDCLYGCYPGTSICKTPVCPTSCEHGCYPGTETCIVIEVPHLSMNNTDFERGTYEGWTVVSNGWGAGPKNGPQANSQGDYYSAPYTGYQGSYFASTSQTKLNTGKLVSEKFTIDKKYVEFLVVGQDDEQLCVGLKINDTTVDEGCGELQANPNTVHFFQPTTGTVSPAANFKRFSWDVSKYKDEYGVIEVIDGSVRSYLEVDDFRQVDQATGTIGQPTEPQGYSCNHNTLCEPGLGEFSYGCPDDCPGATYCKHSSGDFGTVDFTFLCYSFKLTPEGLFLYLEHTGISNDDTVRLQKIKCSEETSWDYSSNATSLDIEMSPGDFKKISDGLTCYDENGEAHEWEPGETFGGRLFIQYRDENDAVDYKIRLNIGAVSRDD